MRGQAAFAPFSPCGKQHSQRVGKRRSCVAPHSQVSSSTSRLYANPLQLLPQETAASILVSEAATTSPSTTFEPVLNVPALGSFLFVMTMALLLRLRVNAIGNAAEERIAALQTLRQVKRQELNSNTTQAQVDQAVMDYKLALQTEENLRTLLPGVRLRAPNNPVQSEQDLQAMRQFLGSSNATTQVSSLPQAQDSDNYDPPANFPTPVLITLWTFIFASLITLFLFLSMDDTMANTVFSTLSSSNSNSGTMAESIGELVGSE